MIKKLFTYCYVLFSLTKAKPDTKDFKLALDNMSLYFNEGTEYDPVYFSKLIKCMSKYDDDISIKAQNNAWKAMR